MGSSVVMGALRPLRARFHLACLPPSHPWSCEPHRVWQPCLTATSVPRPPHQPREAYGHVGKGKGPGSGADEGSQHPCLSLPASPEARLALPCPFPADFLLRAEGALPPTRCLPGVPHPGNEPTLVVHVVMMQIPWVPRCFSGTGLAPLSHFPGSQVLPRS